MWRERYAELQNPYFTFVISRLWRLMPTMLVATVFSATIILIAGGQSALNFDKVNWGHFTFSSVFLIGYAELGSPRLVEPAWSLDIEMRFYLVAPALAVALRLFGAGWFLSLALAIFGLSALGLTAGNPVALLGMKYLIWFAIGMAAEHVRWSPPRWVSTASLAGFVGVIAVVQLLFPAALIDPTLNAENLHLNMLLALVAAPYALATCVIASSKRDREFGDLSYIIYLVHWPVFAVLFVSDAISPLTIAVSLAMIAAISWSVLQYIDQPLQRLRVRWVTSRETSAQLASQTIT